jgi:hypothetical protein
VFSEISVGVFSKISSQEKGRVMASCQIEGRGALGVACGCGWVCACERERVDGKGDGQESVGEGDDQLSGEGGETGVGGGRWVMASC